MPSRELITDSVEFARELSLEIELSSKVKDTFIFAAAVHVMNQRLWASGDNVFAAFKADRAYLNVPYGHHGAEYVSDDSMQRSLVEDQVIQGLVNSFRWVGSAGLSSFGLQVYEAQVLDQSHMNLNPQQKVVKHPLPKNLQSAFIPIEAIDIHAEPFGSLVTHRYIMSDDGETHQLITPAVPLQIHKGFTILKDDAL